MLNTMSDPAQAPVVIAGAGPGGLTAAYLLTKRGAQPVVLEADDVVGGISRTVERDGWRFDLGGHRFFTKVPEVEALWHEILPEGDFMLRPRMSRIFYEGKFYDYPLKAVNALRNLGLWEAILCGFSYLWARIRPPKDESNYENWLVARFGWRLYRTFFKTYTEKVWGVPGGRHAGRLGRPAGQEPRPGQGGIQCHPPKAGPDGDHDPHRGVPVPQVRPRHDVGGLRREGAGRRGDGGDGGAADRHQRGAMARASVGHLHAGRHRRTRRPASHVISTMPMRELVHTITPPPPPEVLAAADDLHYRDYLTVALVVPESRSFPDNWIYIHATDVEVGRIQNYGSWSPYLVKDGRTCLGLEYFVFEGDDMWNIARRRLITLGHQGADLARPGRRRATSSTATSCACPRHTRTTTSPTRTTSTPSASGSRPRRPTSTRSGATACTSTTTRITPCTRRC